MSIQERFAAAAQAALQRLDEFALKNLAFTLESSVKYVNQGHDIRKEIEDWNTEMTPFSTAVTPASVPSTRKEIAKTDRAFLKAIGIRA